MVVINVDEVDIGKVLSQVFDNWKRRLCGQDWSFREIKGSWAKMVFATQRR